VKRAIVFLACLLAVLLTVGAVRAQQPAASAPKGDDAPKLTEVESLHLQVIGLQQQLTSLSVALETCHIEQAHPGYRLDPQKGLVKK
jgi:hypothetical protein